MKAVTAFIISIFLAAWVSGSIFAAALPLEPAKAVKDAGEVLKEEILDIAAQYQGMSQANAALKAAGLSYQKDLTADTTTTSAYTGEDQQAMMAGVFTFDAAYAALFLRKKDLAEALKARRNLGESLGLGVAMPPELKKLVSNPEKLRDFKAFAKAADEHFQALIKEHMTTDERMVILVNGAYGAVVQGLYVVAESIAQAGYPQEMIHLMDQQLVRINFMIRLLDVFQGKESFESALALEPRLKVLENIQGLIESKGDLAGAAEGDKERPPFFIEITQTEVDMIRKIVTPLRHAILSKNS